MSRQRQKVGWKLWTLTNRTRREQLGARKRDAAHGLLNGTQGPDSEGLRRRMQLLQALHHELHVNVRHTPHHNPTVDSDPLDTITLAHLPATRHWLTLRIG